MKRRNIIILIIVSLVVIISSTTLAWFFTSKEANGEITPTKLNDSVSINSYFNFNSNNIEAKNYISNGLLVCNGSDYIKNNVDDASYIKNNKENNIANLKIDISYNAPIAMCIRIKLKSNIVLSKYYYNSKVYRNSSIKEDVNNTNYTIDTNVWYFDSQTRYYYYKKIINKNESSSINFVSGGKTYQVNTKSASYFEEYVYNIGITLEVVQANRYQSVWGINDDFLK